MQIDFSGPDSDFFDRAFFGPFGLGIAFSGVPTSTEIVVVQPDSGALTTITGIGFTFNILGQVTGGTITGTHFFQNGITVAQFSDFSWSATEIFAALEKAGDYDLSALAALYNGQPITLDASSATAGFSPAGFDIDFTSKLKFIGSAFKDNFVGGSDRDVLRGGGQNDVLKGGAGADKLFGGNGNDKIYGGVGSDFIKGGSGADMLVAGSGYGVIFGGNGNDRIIGGDNGNALDGGEGNDKISGGSQEDLILGGRGNDIIFGGGGGTGTDRLRGGRGNDRILGGDDSEVINGNSGRDKLFGYGGTINCVADLVPMCLSTEVAFMRGEIQFTILKMAKI